MPLRESRLRAPVVMSQAKLDVAPSGTSIETVDTHTVPAGTLGRDGDAVEIEWLFAQGVANACTITIEIPSGTGLLADARSAVCDRTVIVRIERVNATTVRRHMRYLYGTGTWYNPAAVVAGIADATAAISCLARLTNGTAATDCKAVSRRVTYFPAVA